MPFQKIIWTPCAVIELWCAWDRTSPKLYQSPPEGKVFPAREGFCKAKTSDGRFARVANAVLGKYRLEKKAKQ
jgi:hypothetical protein